MLRRLVYLSFAQRNYSNSVIEDILTVAGRRNEADQITGLLLFHDGNFFQILEGPEEAVMARYSRISKEPCHSGCLLVISEDVEQRVFADWSIGFMPFDALSEEQTAAFFDIRDIYRKYSGSAVEMDTVVQSLIRTFLSPRELKAS